MPDLAKPTLGVWGLAPRKATSAIHGRLIFLQESVIVLGFKTGSEGAEKSCMRLHKREFFVDKRGAADWQTSLHFSGVGGINYTYVDEPKQV
jgi:hypothetical protein